MTTREALLKAIISTPDDDLPRLVYADWLDENGFDKWAALIRYDCGRLPGGQIDFRFKSAAVRSDLAKLQAVWAVYSDPGFFRSTNDRRSVLLDRGLAGVAKCGAGDWMEHGPGLASWHPVTAVEIKDFEFDHQHGKVRVTGATVSARVLVALAKVYGRCKSVEAAKRHASKQVIAYARSLTRRPSESST